jgi:serine/threonine protein phosphatase PrpC
MLQTACILDSYRRRSQDRAVVIEHREGLVLVVADGAGGTSGGDEAADTVIMWTKALASRTEHIAESGQWQELLSKVDFQVSCQHGQAAAVVAAVTSDGIFGASAGDCAAWLISGEGIADLTAHQLRRPMLGSGAANPIPFERAPFAGTLMLASDGLVNYAPRDRLVAAALEPNLAHAGRRMIDAARLRTGELQDDVAVILCRER